MKRRVGQKTSEEKYDLNQIELVGPEDKEEEVIIITRKKQEAIEDQEIDILQISHKVQVVDHLETEITSAMIKNIRRLDLKHQQIALLLKKKKRKFQIKFKMFLIIHKITYAN